MLVVEHGSVRAYTRNGHDWSDRYPGIIAAARKLPCRSAILDGEVIVQDGRGASDFEALQAALRSKTAQLIFYAFDLLHLDGKDLREKPLWTYIPGSGKTSLEGVEFEMTDGTHTRRCFISQQEIDKLGRSRRKN